MNLAWLIEASLIVSLVGYVCLLVFTVTQRDGAAWTVFRVVLAAHAVGTLGSAWLVTLMPLHFVNHPAYWLIVIGRLGGALGNIVLAIMLLRLIRSASAKA